MAELWQAKPAVLAWSLSVLAHAYRLTLRYDEAIAVYKQAISLAPAVALVHSAAA